VSKPESYIAFIKTIERGGGYGGGTVKGSRKQEAGSARE
jgi:hypothetical protein